jgi:spermidine synthase
MIPWLHLDTATMPGGGGDLKLMQRGQEFSIMAGPIELMNSRLSGSEEALASLVAGRVAGRRKARVLVGGLGMGFTLRAALRDFAADADIVVAELVPEVVAWARGPVRAVHGDSLEEARVTVRVGDVAEAIAEGPWDAILLDVDNGPEGLTRRANDELYGEAGLTAAKRSLTSGGVLAVWSSAPHKAFSQRIRRSGLKVEEVTVRANKGRSGARHVIWLGTAP